MKQSGGGVLLGDNTGGGSVMLRVMMFESICLSMDFIRANFYINISLTVHMVIAVMHRNFRRLTCAYVEK